MSAEGYERLGFPREAEPLAIVHAVSHMVETWQARRSHYPQSWRLRKSGEDTDAVAFSLGLVWGEQVARVTPWEWIYFEQYSFALTSSQREYVLYPVYLVRTMLYPAQWGWSENILVSLFHRIAGGDLPPSTSHAYYLLEDRTLTKE